MKSWGQPRLTLGQLLTIPFFAAAALACIVPVVRSNAVAHYGIVQVLFLEAIMIPIALALVAQVMLARQTVRDRLVVRLLWLSALASRVAILAIAAVMVWDIGASVSTGRGLPVDLLAFLIVLVGGLIALNEVALVLREKLSVLRCPRCGHPMTSPNQPENARLSSLERSCVNCGARLPARQDAAPTDRDESVPPHESRWSTLLDQRDEA